MRGHETALYCSMHDFRRPTRGPHARIVRLLASGLLSGAAASLFVTPCALAQAGDGDIVSWGVSNCSGSEIPPPAAPARPAGTRYIDVACGYYGGEQLFAVRSDGAFVTWGGGSVPPLPGLPAGVGYRTVSAANGRFALVRTDGVVVDGFTIVNPPAGQRFVQAEVGVQHTAALTDAGTIVCWGLNDGGQCNVPALPAPRVYIDVAAGALFTLGLVDDGTIRIWGNNGGWPMDPPALPAGMTYRALGNLSGGAQQFAAIRSDGTAVFWGACYSIGCSDPGPAGNAVWVACSAGGSTLAASRSDGAFHCRDSSGAYNLCATPAIAPGHFVSKLASHNCISAGIVVRDCNLNGLPDADELAAGGADVNGDGTLDQCQCIADLYDDNIVDGVDLGVVLSQWGRATPTVPGDINRDGAVNSLDIAIVLNAWGPCGN